MDPPCEQYIHIIMYQYNICQIKRQQERIESCKDPTNHLWNVGPIVF